MWITRARIRGATQPIAALAVEDLLRNPDREPTAFDRGSSGRREKIRPTLEAKIEKDLLSGIPPEIGCLENQLSNFDPLELRGFQVDLCIEATVKYAAIFAGAFEQPADLGSVVDRTRVKPPQRSFSDRSRPVEQLATYCRPWRLAIGNPPPPDSPFTAPAMTATDNTSRRTGRRFAASPATGLL
jgi:hypothetical protein